MLEAGSSRGRTSGRSRALKLDSMSHDFLDYERCEKTASMRIGGDHRLASNVVNAIGIELGRFLVLVVGTVVSKPFTTGQVLAGVRTYVITEIPPYGNREVIK